MLSNIELLDLERTPHALLRYVLLIGFVHGHNPMLLRRLSKPELYTCREHLMLSTSTLDQLNVTSNTRAKHTYTKTKHSHCFADDSACDSVSKVKRRLEALNDAQPVVVDSTLTRSAMVVLGQPMQAAMTQARHASRKVGSRWMTVERVEVCQT